MKLTIRWFAAAILSLSPLPAQTPIEDPLLRWMDKRAQDHLQARENEIAAVRTVADAERRKAIVRRKFVDALGGLPDYSGPLNARITGQIQADGYVIEKVIYESLPGYYVTANLYRPIQPGRYPAVLLQAGHTQEGKAEPQLLAANLALKGFVSLAFDPVGQGERVQTYSAQLNAPAAGWSSIEHMQAGAQSTLVGEGVARYFIWDAKRSIDYLVSRPDVDPARIGAAGCSGGGALTTFIGALDSRLKAVIPACAPNSYRLLFSGDNPHSEMTLPQLLARGLDTADFVELSAPTPWMIQATEQDFFTPAGTKLVFEEALRWYRLFGAEDRLAYVVGPGPHGTPLVSREAMYQWMIRWLNGGRGDSRELPVKMYTNHELLVTKTGRVEDEPGSRKLHQLILESWRARRKLGTAAELMAELRDLKIPAGGSAPAIKVLEEAESDGFRNQHIQFESEPGIQIDARLYVPSSSGRKPAVLIAGRAALHSVGGENCEDRQGRADRRAPAFSRAGQPLSIRGRLVGKLPGGSDRCEPRSVTGARHPSRGRPSIRRGLMSRRVRSAPPPRASRASGCCWRLRPTGEFERSGWIRHPTVWQLRFTILSTPDCLRWRYPVLHRAGIWTIWSEPWASGQCCGLIRPIGWAG